MKTTFQKFIRTTPSASFSLGIVINSCYGGFQLSEKALDALRKIYPQSDQFFWDKQRTNPNLVKIVETLKTEVNTSNSNLQVVYIPLEFKDFYEIDEEDGFERLRVFPERYVAKEIAGIPDESIQEINDEVLKGKLQKLKEISHQIQENSQN